MKKIIFIFCFIIISFPAFSNELQNVKPTIISIGISKKYDKEQLQKGFQIYNEICSSCHSMNHVRYKDLTQIGINWAKIKEISSNFEYPNGFDDEGEEKIRQGKPFDIIKNPYPNEKYARYINFGALPPDLSLIVKARKNGIYYINNFLNGFNLKPKNK
jgi:cytochrome c1